MSRAHSLICMALIAFQCNAMPTLKSDLQGAAAPAVAESNAVVTDTEGAKEQVIPANIVLTPNPGPSDPSILLFPFVTVDPEEKEELVNAVVNQKGEETQALDANKIENLLSPDCFWAPVAVLPKGIEGGVLAPIEPPFILPVIQSEETNNAVKDYQQKYNKHLAALKASKTRAWTNGQGPGPGLVTSLLQILFGGQGPTNTSLPAGLLSHGFLGAIPLIIHGILANPAVLVDTSYGPSPTTVRPTSSNVPTPIPAPFISSTGSTPINVATTFPTTTTAATTTTASTTSTTPPSATSTTSAVTTTTRPVSMTTAMATMSVG